MTVENKAEGENGKNNNMKINFPMTANIIVRNRFYAYWI